MMKISAMIFFVGFSKSSSSSSSKKTKKKQTKQTKKIVLECFWWTTTRACEDDLNSSSSLSRQLPMSSFLKLFFPIYIIRSRASDEKIFLCGEAKEAERQKEAEEKIFQKENSWLTEVVLSDDDDTFSFPR